MEYDRTPKNVGKSRIVSTGMRWKPFPVGVLPDLFQDYVSTVSESACVDVATPALSVLVTAAAAIGNTRQFELKPGWVEPPILWGVVIAMSGDGKSPAFDGSVEPIKKRQKEAFRDHQEKLAAFREANKGKKKTSDPPPIPDRYWTGDATLEALLNRLQHAPRGLLVFRDELVGWLCGFDKYRHGRGSDVGEWLSIWRGKEVIYDRQAKDNQITHVKRCQVCVLGSIQPDTLRDALTHEYFTNGLAARLVVCMPPRKQRFWSDDGIPHEIKDLYENAVSRLLAIQPGSNRDYEPYPVTLTMTPEAHAMWVDFFNRHAARHAEATSHEAIVLAKSDIYAARLALIIQMMHDVMDGTTSDQIDELSMGAGITLSEWFTDEALRTYGSLHETDGEREQRRVMDWIAHQGKPITVRDLQRGIRGFPTAESAEDMIRTLFRRKLLDQEFVGNGDERGRPTEVFFPSNGVDRRQCRRF